MHLSVVTPDATEDIGPLKLELQAVVSCLGESLKPNLGPVQERDMLLTTELPLRPHRFILLLDCTVVEYELCRCCYICVERLDILIGAFLNTYTFGCICEGIFMED